MKSRNCGNKNNKDTIRGNVNRYNLTDIDNKGTFQLPGQLHFKKSHNVIK